MKRKDEAGQRKGEERRTRKVILDELAMAGRAMSATTILYHSTLAEKLGLTPIEEKVIDIIHREGLTSPSRIREVSRLAPASVTGVIDRLVRKGFVRRVPDPEDRRRVQIHIVEEAVARMAPLLADWFESLDALWRGYTQPELELILDFMGKISARQAAAMANLLS